jgi:phospholipid-transporting ATPase
MRIGIHKGNIIAGITGSTIVRYDIYGPDVYIANKMESYGIPGTIHISDAVESIIR